MPTLHTVNKSPFERNSLETCLSVCKPGASVLLIEDAVVGALENTSISSQILDAVRSGVKIYALNEDLKARGLPQTRLINQIIIVDYARSLELTCQITTVHSWL